jgi:hypothetical protein
MADNYDPKTVRAFQDIEKRNVVLFKENPEATRRAFEKMLYGSGFTPNWKAHGFASKEHAIKSALKAVEKTL